METIRSIREATWKNGSYGHYEGWEIETNLHTYRFGIEHGQSCCEISGYITTEDDFEKFIGADLIEIDTTNTQRLSDTLVKNGEIINTGVSVDSAMFITFKTTAGVFQLVVYNKHNGYYGHDVVYSVDDEKVIDSTI